MIRLNDFGFYRVYRHSKEVIERVLKDFFSIVNREYNFLIPTIKFFKYDEDSEKTKVAVYRDWFQQIRQLPFVIVSVERLTERQLTFEQPPFLGESSEIIGETSTGFVRFGGAVDIESRVVVGAEDADSRGDLIDLLFFFFTIHGKQVRVFKDPSDRAKLVFSIPKKEISVGGETEVQIGATGTTQLYSAEILVPMFIEYSYQMQVRDVIKFFQFI